MQNYRYNFKYIKLKGKIRSFFAKKMTLPTYSLMFGIEKGIKFHKTKNNRTKWMDTCYETICEEFKDFFDEYTFVPVKPKSEKKYIWVCWLQGNEMPDVVKLCIQSLRKNAPDNTEIVILSLNNLTKFITLPDFIYKKLRKGNITLTHFSDIIRMALLKDYGGLWIDSTVFVSNKMPENMVNSFIYSIQMNNSESQKYNPYYGPLTSFILGGSTECMLFDFCYKFFLEYQKKYNILIDGHLINIIYRVIYDNYSDVQKEINKIGINNADVYKLCNIVNQEYDEATWIKITNDQIFHKMNWRLQYYDTKNGESTYYKKMKNKVFKE